MMIVTGGATPMWTDTDTELMLSDDVFFVGGATASPADSITHCLMLVVVVVASTAALLSLLLARERPRDARQQVIEVTTDTGARRSIVPTLAQATALTSEQPPMATAVESEAAGLIWIESSYSKANVQFLKSHRARWCSNRNCWYMLATSGSREVVLERFGSRSEPQPTDAGKFKKSTCTKPCYVCPAPSPCADRSYAKRRRQPSATTRRCFC
jgi:hypothetical protein